MFRDHAIAYSHPLELENAVEQIEALSIGARHLGTDVHECDDTLTIHPVMHKVIRVLDEHLDASVQEKYFDAALSIVIGSAGPHESRDFPLESVSLHVIQCHADFSKYRPSVDGERSRHLAELAELMHKMAKIAIDKKSPESLDAAAAWFARTRSAYRQLGGHGRYDLAYDLAWDETRLEINRCERKCCPQDETVENLRRIYELLEIELGASHSRTMRMLAFHGEILVRIDAKKAHEALSKAYERYLQSPQAKELFESKKMYSCLGWLGIACETLGRYEQAVRHLSEALVYFSDKDRSKALGYATRIPRIYSKTGQLPEERDALKIALDFRELSKAQREDIKSRFDEVERLLRVGPYRR